MRRFGRRLDVEGLRAELPLSGWWFDCLQLDGEVLLDRSARERVAALAAAVPDAQRIPRIVTADPETADAFLRGALDAGHEGLMAKSLDAAYEAGGRGQAWLKLKLAHTLDLVVLAAEWGSGRRQGWLSNLHLGARCAGRPSSCSRARPAATPGPCTCGRSWWSRWPSTTCRTARTIPPGWRCASRA
jgi:DNA ligase-1